MRAVGIAASGALISVAIACGPGAQGGASGPSSELTGERWAETCRAAVQRNIKCAKISPEQEEEAAKVCVASETCAKRNLRPDFVGQYMECEARATCAASCTETVGAIAAPTSVHAELQAACEKIPSACVGQKRGCDALVRSNPSHLLSDTLLGELRGCVSTTDCEVMGSCFSQKMAQLGDVQFLCANPGKK
ncbi:MAG: hypothetical protein JNL38_11705 [Myxococcales bacterium]|jgi:hypothetical protein|nr:hypothetical protein [Myxococcales bacterium]